MHPDFLIILSRDGDQQVCPPSLTRLYIYPPDSDEDMRKERAANPRHVSYYVAATHVS